MLLDSVYLFQSENRIFAMCLSKTCSRMTVGYNRLWLLIIDFSQANPGPAYMQVQDLDKMIRGFYYTQLVQGTYKVT